MPHKMEDDSSNYDKQGSSSIVLLTPETISNRSYYKIKAYHNKINERKVFQELINEKGTTTTSNKSVCKYLLNMTSLNSDNNETDDEINDSSYSLNDISDFDLDNECENKN